ncbi:MAG: cysteinyl-tRNA synthetase [Candidatus Syntrophoarchaeum butanivorans]|uniref:O-phospho-L-seryl-tRNA:Cys-tRNA synthase n=1 Tax=Candidatus Syntropharchaeum butanivorans TaxID=1839936 RepID=A0A1F2P6D0_9EURY|nr:MAG: cysteinyl-tRNA synthetase [Candidatus Syntrophoarchaeum butanivorans]
MIDKKIFKCLRGDESEIALVQEGLKIDIRISKIYEALFTLEEMREVFRHALPAGLDDSEEERIDEGLKRLERILDEIRQQKGNRLRYVSDKIELRTREEEFINIDPIQAGGRLTLDARKALIAYGDGYSVCDNCLKPFRLDKIKKPPIDRFHDELAAFLGMDEARVVPGARRGFQAVVSSLVERGDPVLLTSLSHYTEFLAVEESGGVVREVMADENNIITADRIAERIEEIERKDGKKPVLMILDHFDYQFGNEHDVYGAGRIAKEYDIPFLYNGAYTVGIMPVDGKKIGADFVVGSGHKSMASSAPSGVLAVREEWVDKIFRTTDIRGDLTGRKFGVKEVEMLGCTLMGAPLLTMMASFPHVKERVKRWDEEVRRSNRFIETFLKIKGNRVLSEMPRKHTLTRVDTSASFDEVAKTHKKRGYFLTSELKKRGITGVFEGATREWKFNTYGLTDREVEYLGSAFIDIAKKYGIEVEA